MSRIKRYSRLILKLIRLIKADNPVKALISSILLPLGCKFLNILNKIFKSIKLNSKDTQD